MIKNELIPSSFRDPSGFLFSRNGVLHRQINLSYKEDYDLLMGSGLYNKLVSRHLLVPHEEIDIVFLLPEKGYKVIKPEQIPFISYPYEWSFGQLKDAALTTLKIQKIALEHGMSLKDSSAYNIQFMDGKPVLIDTLSFEKYSEGKPWIAYRQFCQHFLAPLLLMAYRDVRLNQLLRIYIDGIPVDLAASLLPRRSFLKFSVFSHIYLHSKSQKHYANKTINKVEKRIGRLGFLGIMDSLESAIKGLKWKPDGTEWANYYEDTNYSEDATNQKKQIVSDYIDIADPKKAWDLGANNGLFSRISSRKGIQTVSFDIDPSAVEINYLQCVKNKETHILPLLLDLTNPSPGIGWVNQERMSFTERGPVDLVLSLALIHHLAISNNLPLSRIANFYSKICNWLIIEFVPKGDSQVKRLLSTRADIFPDYTQQSFEREFKRYFSIERSQGIADSDRTLYLMRKG